MTTSAFNTSWAVNTNAGFQAWGSELATAIQAVGFTKTSDTGQINWSTVATPTANNTVAGYEIYQFTDSLQSTSPIFFKVEYGSGPNHVAAASGYPMVWITVGKATDGAGNLMGVTTTRATTMGMSSASGGITSPSTTYPSYVCGDGSYLGVMTKVGGLTQYYGAGDHGPHFMLGRPTNSSGAYVAGGVVVLTPNFTPVGVNVAATWTIQTLNTAPATAVAYSNNAGQFALVPFAMTSSLISAGNFQCFPCYAMVPQVYALNWLAYGLNSETAQFSTVTMAIDGTTAQTYMMTGNVSYGAATPSSTNYSLLMKYQ